MSCNKLNMFKIVQQTRLSRTSIYFSGASCLTSGYKEWPNYYVTYGFNIGYDPLFNNQGEFKPDCSSPSFIFTCVRFQRIKWL